MRRVPDTDLWYVVPGVPEGSRLDYQFQVRRGDHVERLNDPRNPRRSYSPFGSLSVCFAHGYTTPEWTQPDPAAPRGTLTDLVVDSRALGRDCNVTIYLPASFRPDARYPLLVVHDGGDFLQYAAAKAVLDNLIHRGDLAATVVAFLHPKDRLTEYADSPGQASAACSAPASAPSRAWPRRTGRPARTPRSSCCPARSSSPRAARTTAVARCSSR